MRFSTATVHRTTKPWRGGRGETPVATILVIDDQKPIRALLRLVLEGAGHDVLEASNGRLGQRRLVLVVSEVCAGGYGAGRVREGRTRSEERPVGRSAAAAAVGVVAHTRGGAGRVAGMT